MLEKKRFRACLVSGQSKSTGVTEPYEQHAFDSCPSSYCQPRHMEGAESEGAPASQGRWLSVHLRRASV